jgi:radical SAM protein with 4Fe4S-binding SPASM domain
MHQVPFFVDIRHLALAEPGNGWLSPNIGADGANVTIVLLSMNRSNLTIRMVESVKQHVPYFAGRILVADNGSSPEELTALRQYLQVHCPFAWQILEFGTNFGVAGGRNRAFREVDTDWVLSLDNDIYLAADPFPTIQRDMGLLGCRFLSVPLLNPDLRSFYSFGGHLSTSIQNREPRLTIDFVLPPGSNIEAAERVAPEGTPFLCSFLFGGASVLHRDSFFAEGAFDDAMFIGFEDIDFSLRLFRAGMKVGCSALTAFVHDHPPAENDPDRDYERRRFSRQVLHESAMHLEQKTGFRVWGEEVDSWLAENERKQGFVKGGSTAAVIKAQVGASPRRKPRIALITDIDGWAFANISNQIKRHLSSDYEFDIIPMVRLGEIEKARWRERGSKGHYWDGGASALGQLLIQSTDYDIIHFFWREYLTLVGTPLLETYAAFLGMTSEEFFERFIRSACITTAVYDHLHGDAESITARRHVFNEISFAYTVSSERLNLHYRAMADLRPPSMVIEDGVDTELFYPQNLERFDDIANREIVIGWVGNSKWAATLEDFKGVHTILIPAVEQLRADGLPVRLELADRQTAHVPHAEMPRYYASIDLYVCTSKIEGTPNPVMESMACGVPVITTDVGIVPQVFGPLQRQFILEERSIECLKAAVRRLMSQPEMFRRLSEENLHFIEPWAWHRQVKKFDSFFQQVLRSQAIARGALPTKMCMLPFANPSIEPDGSVRLCSASSIFAYRDETNMGNARRDGLGAVWRGPRYQTLRRSLLTGDRLSPYCTNCEYRHSGPAWMLQLHLALHAIHNGVDDADTRNLLARHLHRYAEYQAKGAALGLQPLALPADLNHSSAPQGPVLMPEALIEARLLPIYLDLNTLNRCNVSCVMCPPAIRHDQQGIKRDPYYRLTLDEYRLLTEGLNVKTAHFVGAYAEPLLNKDIFTLVQHAHDTGAFTAITTNAMPLSVSFAERLVDAGLDMMSISLHGAKKATAEAIMLKSNFERVIENIRVLQDVKRSRGITRPEIYFNFVSQLANVQEMPDFVDLAASLNVRNVNIIHLIDGDEAVRKEDNLLRYPELLLPNLREAQCRAAAKDVNLSISPAYAEILLSTRDLGSVLTNA